MLDVRTLVEGLGGGAALARKLRVTPSAVAHWVSANEVPPQRVIAVWKLATEAGLPWAPPGAEGFVLAPRPEAEQPAEVAA